ncbi:calcium-activated potassium channel subunit beta-1 [Rhinatrema bivittatum]|uniref:calcium-activated potassium channel subunit beta-1 n=1 Tax=Rhinatrema bivittatum TaxID=194408 RepID=UPI001129D1A6|nr:calcium-activated potassium channel subunit beta-1 [Rhinatrema bivittatum]XP_029439834.1 calcium-activated potassium channel subunit beta-1 [Rhinatrema bivittatum]
MVLCSVIMYFLVGTTALPLHRKSIWTQEETCSLVQASVRGVMECVFNPAPNYCKTSNYPCLLVTVIVNHSSEKRMLYHMEDSLDINPKCSYVPQCKENTTETKIEVEEIAANFRRVQSFRCHYDPNGEQKTVILIRQYGPLWLIFYLLLPTFMMIGGVSIVILVKISQYFSLLAAQNTQINL